MRGNPLIDVMVMLLDVAFWFAVMALDVKAALSTVLIRKPIL